VDSSEEGQKKHRGEQGEVGVGAEVGSREMAAIAVENEKQCGGQGTGSRDRVSVDKAERDPSDAGGGVERGKICEREAGGCVGRARIRAAFPEEDKEAVEGAERGEEHGRQQEDCMEGRFTLDRFASYGGDEDGGGKEKSNRDLLGQPMCAADAVDDQEPRDEENGFEEVKPDCSGAEMRKECCEGDGGDGDPEEEGVTMAIVEVVAKFKTANG
jgi:hypothetical protein